MTLKPMLATEATNLVRLLESPDYSIERKVDGVRLLIHWDGHKITTIGRNGKLSKYHYTIAGSQSPLSPYPMILDCEYVNDLLYVYDLPLFEGPDITIEPKDPFHKRRRTLEKLFADSKRNFFPHSPVFRRCRLLVSYPNVSEVRHRFVMDIYRFGGEGIIAKKLDSPYVQGRSPDVLKVKFWKSADCFVTDMGRNGKQNLTLSVYEGSTEVEIGEVTALAGDGPRCRLRDVVEVKFLHCGTKTPPRLYQPTLPRLRTDKSPSECTMDQLLVYRKEEQTILPSDSILESTTTTKEKGIT